MFNRNPQPSLLVKISPSPKQKKYLPVALQHGHSYLPQQGAGEPEAIPKLLSGRDTGSGNGRSVGILGKALRGRRQEAVIAPKVAPPLGPDHVKRAGEESLRRLGVESVDLYQLQAPDSQMPPKQCTRWGN